MNTEVTIDAEVEVWHDGTLIATVHPYTARSLGLELLQAADSALTQAARNFAFRTNQRTTP